MPSDAKNLEMDQADEFNAAIQSLSESQVEETPQLCYP